MHQSLEFAQNGEGEKHLVRDSGGWRCLIGEKDLRDIARLVQANRKK